MKILLHLKGHLLKSCCHSIFAASGHVTGLLKNNLALSTGWALAAVLLLSLISAPGAMGQKSNLLDNQFTPIISSRFSNLTVTSSQVLFSDQFSSKGNVIDGDTSNASSWTAILGITASIQVTDNNATGSDAYPGGSYAGFVVADNSLLSALSNTDIVTYLDGVEKERMNGSSLLSVGLLSNKAKIGFYTTLDFNSIQLEYTGGVSLLPTVTVYYAEVGNFTSPGPGLNCNTNTYPRLTDYPIIVQPERTGLSGIGVGSITNPDRAIDNDSTNFASVNLTVSVGGSANFSIQDQVTTYPGGTFAGMDINNPALLGANLLGNLTITTYLDGIQQDQSTGGNLLSVPSSLLSGTGRQIVGFVTTQDFDEVQLTITATGASLGTTQIYGMVLKKFCSANITDCNMLTPGTNPEFPVYINGANTGVDVGVCAGCSINNTENVIDGDSDNYATVDFAAGVLTDISLSVANALDDYNANTFVGFDLGLDPLLNVDVLGSATIELFKDGNSVQTSSGDALLAGVTSTVLQGGFSRQPIGIIADQAFDEVKITFTQTAQVDLGTIRVYNALFTTTCAGTLSCHETNFMIGGKDNLPVYINSERTGTSGAVGASKIENPWNVANDDPDDFANVQVIAGVAGSASISVIDATNTYPAGSVAGFVISNESSLSQVNLFESLTITTYLDGGVQETGTGDDLLNLDLLGLITIPGAEFQPSFMTTLPFDEVQISFGGVANVLNHVHVYSAFADLRYVNDGGSYTCNIGTYNPDFNTTYVDVTVNGDVSTNDQPNGTATYSPPVADPGNPSGGTLNMNSNGTYDFTSTNAGVFNYDVPACVNGTCTSRLLQITVLDDNITTNPPVANPDYGRGPAGDPIVINSIANDIPGNKNETLDPASVSVTTQPTNGSVSVNTSTGETTYTPDPGFTGRDSLEYEVCDASSNCATSWQYFTVIPDGLENSTDATDDQVSTTQGTIANGNVSINDIDPEGDPQTVTAQSTTIPGKGTLVLNTDGSYTFTPDPVFTGPVDFPYTTCEVSNPSVCASATLHVLVEEGSSRFNPDFNTTYVDVTVNGDVSTNDQPNGTASYGTPQADSNNPSGGSLNMTSNGSYDFTSTNAGVFNYDVPVCVSGTCTSRLLQITVLDDNITTNPPVANPDYGRGPVGDPITINSIANDIPGNKNVPLDTSSVTITAQPSHGSVSVNTSTGETTYTPDPGFTGRDSLEYMVCDAANNCATTWQYFTVTPGGTGNSTDATDDQMSTPQGMAVNGNVSTNDIDPEGDNQMVTAQNTTTSEGTLVLNSDGTFTFTPASGFSGPVDFPYQTCDNGSPQACAMATLHILVEEGKPDLTPGITVNTATINEGGSVNITYNYTNLGPANTDGSQMEFRIFKLSTFGTITLDPLPSGWTATDEGNYYSIKSTNIVQVGLANNVSIDATFVHDGDDENAVIELVTDIIANSGGEVNSNNNYDNQIIQIN